MPCGTVSWSSLRRFAPAQSASPRMMPKMIEHRRGDPQRSQHGLDLVLEEEAEHDDRDRADDDEPAHAGVGVVARHAAGERAEPVRDDAHDVAPEEDDDRGLGAELRDRGERGARILRTGQELTEDAQVRARGDREEFGEALHKAEDERFDHVGHPPSASAEAGGRDWSYMVSSRAAGRAGPAYRRLVRRAARARQPRGTSPGSPSLLAA